MKKLNIKLQVGEVMMKTLVKVMCVASVCLVMVSQGCYTYRVHAPGKVAVDEHNETIWSFAWGLVHERPRVNCHDQALAEVTVTDFFAYDFITVVTLGFASPKKVEWRCASPQPEIGVFRLAPSDSTGRN